MERGIAREKRVVRVIPCVFGHPAPTFGQDLDILSWHFSPNKFVSNSIIFLTQTQPSASMRGSVSYWHWVRVLTSISNTLHRRQKGKYWRRSFLKEAFIWKREKFLTTEEKVFCCLKKRRILRLDAAAREGRTDAFWELYHDWKVCLTLYRGIEDCTHTHMHTHTRRHTHTEGSISQHYQSLLPHWLMSHLTVNKLPSLPPHSLCSASFSSCFFLLLLFLMFLFSFCYISVPRLLPPHSLTLRLFPSSFPSLIPPTYSPHPPSVFLAVICFFLTLTLFLLYLLALLLFLIMPPLLPPPLPPCTRDVSIFVQHSF